MAASITESHDHRRQTLPRRVTLGAFSRIVAFYLVGSEQPPEGVAGVDGGRRIARQLKKEHPAMGHAGGRVTTAFGFALVRKC